MADWEKIVAKHSGIVWRTAYRILGTQPDAADCFQNTFISALEVSRRQRVRNWAALLRRLATCKALDLLRAKHRSAREIGESACLGIASDNPGPVEQAIAAELSDRLRRALSELPDAQAEVFCLRYLSDLKYRQIAQQLGVKTSAVGVLLHRARLRLRELLSSKDAVVDAEVPQ